MRTIGSLFKIGNIDYHRKQHGKRQVYVANRCKGVWDNRQSVRTSPTGKGH